MAESHISASSTSEDGLIGITSEASANAALALHTSQRADCPCDYIIVGSVVMIMIMAMMIIMMMLTMVKEIRRPRWVGARKACPVVWFGALQSYIEVLCVCVLSFLADHLPPSAPPYKRPHGIKKKSFSHPQHSSPTPTTFTSLTAQTAAVRFVSLVTRHRHPHCLQRLHCSQHLDFP